MRPARQLDDISDFFARDEKNGNSCTTRKLENEKYFGFVSLVEEIHETMLLSLERFMKKILMEN